MPESYNAHQLADLCGGILSGNGNACFSLVTTDTRRPGFPAETLFVAMPGHGRNGSRFIPDYYQRGCRNFLTDQLPEDWQTLMPGAAFVLVKNPLKALQGLAAYHRSKFTYPVLGITGSNGKTIVKEWLNQCLGEEWQLVRSPGSYNSQVGVSLSIMLLGEAHQFAIFEAGISRTEEMDQLAGMMQPTIGVLTNIGSAHSEGFASETDKLAEKCRLFAGCQWVLAREKEVFSGAWPNELLPKTISWGNSKRCFFSVDTKMLSVGNTAVDVTEGGMEKTSWSFFLPFTDEASVENGIITALLLRLLGFKEEKINRQIGQIHAIEMRLAMQSGINGSTIINDSYSHDESGLVQALNYWREQAHGSRTIIISDPGNEQTNLDNLVGLLQQQQLNKLIAVGPRLATYPLSRSLADQVFIYPNTAALVKQIGDIGFENETILLKGARRFQFEQIAGLLTDDAHETVLEIHLDALRANLQFFRSRLKPNTKIMVMIKAFGYGSGDAQVARLLQHSGIDYLAVAYPNEGIALRKAGISLPIMVLNASKASFAQLEQWNLEPELFSFQQMQAFAAYCDSKGLIHYPVHLKIDTGLHRLGFLPAEIEDLQKHLKKIDSIRVKSVFTHFIDSGNAEADAVSLHQIEVFQKAVGQLGETVQHALLHMANSQGILRFPQAHFHMVRLGIGLYGGGAKAQPALVWRTTVAQIKAVKMGDTIGYGIRNKMYRDGKIAVLRVGYADGFPRTLGKGKWQMLLSGYPAPTIGDVCMDMTMIDITDCGEVKEGDEAIIFGPGNSLEQMAAAAGTISYEIMTGISQRVARMYVQP